MLPSIGVQIEYLKVHGKSMSSLNTLEGHTVRHIWAHLKAPQTHLSKGPSIMVSALASAMMSPTHGGRHVLSSFQDFFHIEYYVN